jgi:hypothetical protein
LAASLASALCGGVSQSFVSPRPKSFGFSETDEWAGLKRRINELLGSRLVEEKQYGDGQG